MVRLNEDNKIPKYDQENKSEFARIKNRLLKCGRCGLGFDVLYTPKEMDVYNPKERFCIICIKEVQSEM